jgi:hypothetical protein
LNISARLFGSFTQHCSINSTNVRSAKLWFR